MQTGIVRQVCLAACLWMAASAAAQEGHPLKGTWSGDWGPSAQHRNPVTVIMDWNGKEITGAINPGPGSVPFKKATLDPATWTVRIEAEAKDRSGKPVQYVIEGKLENLGSARRSLVGTWVHDNVKGDFRITRY